MWAITRKEPLVKSDQIGYNLFMMTPQMQRTAQTVQGERSGMAIPPPVAGRKVGAYAPAWAPIFFGIVVLLIALVGLTLLFLNRAAPKSDRWGFWGFQSLMAVLGSSTGMLITRRYPRHPIGWMLLVMGLLAALTGFSEEFAIYAAHARPHWVPASIIVAGLFNWMWAPSYALSAIYIPLLFPTGRFLSPRWRIVAWLGTAWMVLNSAWMILLPGPLPNNGDVINPFGIEAWNGTLITALDPRVVTPMAGMFLMLTAAASLVIRYRRSQDPVTQQQLKWFAYAAVMMSFAGMVGQLSGPVANVLLFLMAASMPVSIAIAILRYRLYDIDLLINRTLVYGVLTVLVVGLYALAVGAAGALVQTQGNWAAALLATALVAVLFHPLHIRLQRGVNRLLYGERDAPLAVLSQLGRRMESAVSPEAMLSVLTETVAKALKLPYVAVGLRSDGQLAMAAEYGKPTTEVRAFPLIYREQAVGQLLVAPRQPGDAFNQTDIALLENVARQAGAVAHSAQLTADLRRSRQRLVSAREEERRRLRRDLHDGLGPHLASMTLTIEVVVRLIDSDPQAAVAILQKLKRQSQSAVQEIRRLVYELRPPALDDLGLTAALRESAARYAQSGVQFLVDAPDPMPSLPAAVEVAAFRIAQEGMTNVMRHAHASTCRITLTLEREYLCVTVEDDGHGLPTDLRMGVGLRSMQERVAELEGHFTLKNDPHGGTVIRAWLPLVELS